MFFRCLMRFLMILGVINTLNCRSTGPNSGVRDAADDANAPSGFGVETTYTLAALKDTEAMTGTLEHRPWADTYWPLFEAGTAARWIDREKAAAIHESMPREYNAEDYDQKAQEAINQAVAYAGSVADDWQKSLYLSPAEKYDLGVRDANFGHTRRELNSFAENFKNYETNSIEWGWMGHCHGWAPAAHLYDPPKYAVMWNAGDRKIFFTPGDVRALLTKGAADNKLDSEVSFLGTRCNAANAALVRDKRGRIVDGLLGKWADGSYAFSKPIKIFRNNWFNHGELGSQGVELVFQFGPSYTFSKKYWMRAMQWVDQRKKIVGVEIFTTAFDAGGELIKDRLIASNRANPPLGCSAPQLDVQSNSCRVEITDADRNLVKARWRAIFNVTPNRARTEGDDDLNNFTHFSYQKQCRDLNAGAFHAILVKHLSKAGIGSDRPQSFVFDVTRDEQVWNHPVYRFDTKIGEPTALSVVDTDGKVYKDPYRIWRAKGTKKIVDVYTRMIYGVENGPFVAAKPEDDALSYKIYHYTMELNGADEVIGGEWHGRVKLAEWYWDRRGEMTWFEENAQPKSGADLYKHLRQLAARHAGNENEWVEMADSPDFAWLYRNGTKIGTGPINAGFVHKVYECSRDENLTRTNLDIEQLMPQSDQRTTYGVEYVECSQ
jgi:hypothetical protein